MSELISVIMSVYNETNKDLESSINSVLTQTYSNFEFIIVDDNPSDMRVRGVLESQLDNRIRVIYNRKNMGLVYSLNEALKIATGSIIARMDADDVAEKNRLEVEYWYLKTHQLDLVGTWIRLINSNGDEIGKMKFPVRAEEINRRILCGGCLAHPTWMGKMEMFSALGGYRFVPYCEDYDFLLRAIGEGYKLGNVPQYGLRYRVRENGISKSNQNKQLAIRRFLSDQKRKNNMISAEEIEKYISSEKFRREIKKLDAYENAKKKVRHGNLLAIIDLFCNRNLYVYLYEKCVSSIYSWM